MWLSGEVVLLVVEVWMLIIDIKVVMGIGGGVVGYDFGMFLFLEDVLWLVCLCLVKFICYI